MIRTALFGRTARRDLEDDFRWRGEGVSRLENLSDIVFAFAVSFLVASAEVPSTFGELARVMVDFVGIGVCFAVILLVWYVHYLFFRRYGLEDGRTVLLNSLLLFLILFYVYPLRFLTNFQTDLITGELRGAEIRDVLAFGQGPWLQAIYSAGYAGVFAVFALLYRHALSKADELGLSDVERVLTRQRIWGNVIHVSVAVAATALAFALPLRWSPMSGAVYFALWPLLAWEHRRSRQRLEALTQGRASPRRPPAAPAAAEPPGGGERAEGYER
ncbi:TMEM175 family protein [Rubrivirga sp.]|uniref:TMEM175 family protein n=1 Tax=Rubrivirga sp. TaxID=1885344 RepID=UPI003B527BCF